MFQAFAECCCRKKKGSVIYSDDGKTSSNGQSGHEGSRNVHFSRRCNSDSFTEVRESLEKIKGEGINGYKNQNLPSPFPILTQIMDTFA